MFCLTFAILSMLCIALLAILRALDLTDERQQSGGYRMSRRQRRAIERTRRKANPTMRRDRVILACWRERWLP